MFHLLGPVVGSISINLHPRRPVDDNWLHVCVHFYHFFFCRRIFSPGSIHGAQQFLPTVHLTQSYSITQRYTLHGIMGLPAAVPISDYARNPCPHTVTITMSGFFRPASSYSPSDDTLSLSPASSLVHLTGRSCARQRSKSSTGSPMVSCP